MRTWLSSWNRAIHTYMECSRVRALLQVVKSTLSRSRCLLADAQGGSAVAERQKPLEPCEASDVAGSSLPVPTQGMPIVALGVEVQHLGQNRSRTVGH